MKMKFMILYYFLYNYIDKNIIIKLNKSEFIKSIILHKI